MVIEVMENIIIQNISITHYTMISTYNVSIIQAIKIHLIAKSLNVSFFFFTVWFGFVYS